MAEPGWALFGQFDRLGWVHVEEFLRGDQRRMRRHEGTEQHPGLAVLAQSIASQPFAGLGSDLPVIVGIAAFAGTNPHCHVARLVPHRQRIAQQAVQVAHATFNVHRQDLPVKAG